MDATKLVFLWIFGYYVLFWLFGSIIISIIILFGVRYQEKKNAKSPKRINSNKNSMGVMKLLISKSDIYLNTVVFLLYFIVTIGIMIRGRFSTIEIIILAMGFVKTFLFPLYSLFFQEEVISTVKLSFDFVQIFILSILADSALRAFPEFTSQIAFSKEASSSFIEIVNIIQATLTFSMVARGSLLWLPVSNKNKDNPYIDKYFYYNKKKLRRINMGDFIYMRTIFALPFFLVLLIPRAEIPTWVVIFFIIAVLLSILSPFLTTLAYQKYKDKYIPIFNKIEYTIATLPSVFAVLYIMYGIGVIDWISTLIATYFPNFKDQTSKWVSNIFGYIISGIIGNYAHAFIEKIRLSYIDKQINNKKKAKV